MSLAGTRPMARRPANRAADLVAAELMKIRTVSTWWLCAGGVALVTALALWTDGVSDHFTLYPQLAGLSGAARTQALSAAAHARTPAGAVSTAVGLMTAGQLLGILIALVFATLVSTNETEHQTATATFLATPRRGAVVGAKLAAAVCFGALFWLISTVLAAITTTVFLPSQHLTVRVTSWAVIRPVLLSLLVYVLWAVLGVGLGAVLRGQLGGVIAAIAVYLAGYAAVEVIFHAIYNVYHHSWVLSAVVIAPAVASQVAVTGGQAFPHAPPQWAGGVILAGYALVLAVAGLILTRRRDVA